MLRRFRIPLLGVLLAGVVALVGIIDHHEKRARLNHAEVGEWYCEHRAIACRPSFEGHIERDWNRRELGYELSLAALGLASTVTFIRAFRH